MGNEDEENTAPRQIMASWHALTEDETSETLLAGKDHISSGLSSSEVEKRKELYGLNKMSEPEKETIWEKIWKQVANVLVLILVIVAAVSAARAIVEMLREEKDGTTILTSWVQVALITTVITVNTFIGIMQEGSAEKAAEALGSMLAPNARVIRDGVEGMIPATEVVPGDIIILSLGDRVPADLRVTQSTNMACQEAALTGESVPIDKQTSKIELAAGTNAELTPLGDRNNMCFSATLVAQGSGQGIAVTTGDYTQIGTINRLVSQVEKKKTNVLEQIDKVSKILAVMISTATLVTFLISKFVRDAGTFDAVSTALVCCVAMIPEGLEAIVTLVYSWATINMAKQNAIIRALPAVETLGSVTVICSDKTGTLTQNVMSLTAFVTSNARYKFDVNNKDRVPTNFVRDDTHIAKRANTSAVSQGASSGEKRKGRLDASNHFGIDSSGHADNEEVEEEIVVSGDSTPVSNGASPPADFVKDILIPGVLCSKCILGKDGSREGELGNPTEISILRAAYFSGIDVEGQKKERSIVAEVPFSSDYKFMATVHEHENGGDNLQVYVKGAPDRMVKVCKNQAVAGLNDETEDIDADYWTKQIQILSSHGLRVLALCKSTVSRSEIKSDSLDRDFVDGQGQWLTMVGLCAIMDPPRPECVQAITEAKGAGVRVAMITGDHKDTATAIGLMLGIVDEKYDGAITGPELDEFDDDQMRETVMKYNVFARASPQNKIRIVKALQACKQICSMTGDGVNDAPALKAADMGVAMGLEGTDVAREASDMILADDNFATIVTAVREGRVVWDNLRKVLLINTPINNAQGMTVLFGLACGLTQSPLSPIQVLYSNLICAITLGFVSAIEPAEPGIMELAPRRIGKRLIGRYLLLRILFATAVLTALCVGSAFILKSYNPAGSDMCDYDDRNTVMCEGHKYYWEDIRALAFNVLDFGAIGVTLSARFAYNSSISPRIFYGNKYCWYSVGIVAVLQVGLIHIPGVNSVIFQMKGLDALGWGITFGFMFVIFFAMELEKAFRRVLRAKGSDTDDAEYQMFDNIQEATDENHGKLLPTGASKLNLVSMEK